MEIYCINQGHVTTAFCSVCWEKKMDRSMKAVLGVNSRPECKAAHVIEEEDEHSKAG